MTNQIAQSKFIRKKFSKYLKSIFDIRDNTYNELYIRRLSELESKLYKGPYLASAHPFKQSKSAKKLVEESFFHKSFFRVGELDFDRPCYAHQIKSFERIASGHNVVVTTGTGSGKTECFMLPIINELIKEYQSGHTEPGVRAIFLFPLNALVYDQIDRLRALLKNYKEIKFGFYTGETPENEKSKDGRKKIEIYRRSYGAPIENEILTREKMRETPPQILFTNYSMLEYLLIRPTEQSLVSAEALKHLKFFVLDEAHTYKGALGIEIALLLRRLQGMANKNPQFVLTSATLGRGKEDLQQIIMFAEHLTSSTFEPDDVIFGIRHDNFIEAKYTVNPEDYPILYNNLENEPKFIQIYEKYRTYDTSVSINVNLFELLRRDENAQQLFHLTKNVLSYNNVLDNLYGFDDTSLTSLVELVTKSRSEDSKYPLKLYDIKYHMFVKAPDGAFVTLGPEKDLSLVMVDQINNSKAFKIGICQNCKVPYVMGITEGNILHIDDEIDIDESYADKARRLEYYLIADSLTEEECNDLNQNSNFKKYFICTKCGFLKKASSATGKNCEHFDSNKAILYKFNGKDDAEMDEDNIVSNNIHRCPICDYKANNGGVIMGFHVGKDRATTLIAQILYESMEYPTKKEKASPDSLFATEDKIIKLRKQFLAFSDSRQQAAFFSKFLNTYNDRFLKKTIMWHLLKENQHNEIPYLTLVSRLNDIFKNDFHYSDAEAIKHAKATALWELLLIDGRNSGEGVGLFAFKLNVNRGHYVQDEVIENAFKRKGFTNVTAAQLRDVTCLLFTIFRMSPSVEYEALATDDAEEKKELLGYRQHNIYISLQETKKNNVDKDEYYPVKSFLPVQDDSSKKSSVNNVVKYVKKTFGYDTDKAKVFLRILFQLAIDEGVLVKNSDPTYPNTYMTKSSDYSLYSYKKLKFYKCNRCHKLTLYNINNMCTEADCDGQIEECNVDNDNSYKNNYYRNEYINRPLEKLICREHTAQMNADEAKEIQNDFKSETGKINFISCSTTFEMGIDLGGLNTVFMRNVPPTPANYAQRAGRAGRRAETSAFILTFCSTTSHDYTFFAHPEEMIRGLVKPPYFVIDNDKIIMRHITATALSLFFREPEYQEDYQTVEYYLKEDVTAKFLAYIKGRPSKLGSIIDTYVLKTDNLLEKYGNFKWIEHLGMSESALIKMCEGLKEQIRMYNETIEYAKGLNQWSICRSCEDALNRLNTRNSLITYFSKYNVIPGYGFPVDNVELHIYDYATQDMDTKYNLSRDLSVAISEYAPDSEVIVDEKKYTSRYLYLPYKDRSLPKMYYCECERCHTINTNIVREFFTPGRKCKYCDTVLDTSGDKVKSYLTPIHGFVADKRNKNTKRIKPFKTYASDTFYIGNNVSSSGELNNVVEVAEYKDEELLVLNENRFFACPLCGYTVLDKKWMHPSKQFEHNDYLGRHCRCSSLLLTHLGHSYKTDIVRIGFNNISEMHDRDTAISVLFAVLEGISMTYEIERNDIGGLVYSANTIKPYDLILFDTVSGGAGHVKRLKDDKSLYEVLKNALKKVSQDCCSEETSCYNCLRTYNNQRLHKHIKRGLAKNALTTIIKKIQDDNVHYVISEPALDFKSINLEDAIEVYSDADSDTYSMLKTLFKELQRQKAAIPSGFGYTLTSDRESRKECADFAWMDKNILLFTINHMDSYYNLVHSQNQFKCYLLTESFDYVSFVAEVDN